MWLLKIFVKCKSKCKGKIVFQLKLSGYHESRRVLYFILDYFANRILILIQWNSAKIEGLCRQENKFQFLNWEIEL